MGCALMVVCPHAALVVEEEEEEEEANRAAAAIPHTKCDVRSPPNKTGMLHSYAHPAAHFLPL